MGTCLEERKNFPNALKKTNGSKKKGEEPTFTWCGKLTVATLQDTKRANIMSTAHSNNVIEKRVRSRNEQTGFRIVKKSAAAEDYNEYMSGVDTFDQLTANYSNP